MRFTSDDDLAYYEVKPLLRLPERKLQLENDDALLQPQQSGQEFV